MIGDNNILNIRYNLLNRWYGQYGKTKGFCNFRDPVYCFRAGAILLMRSYRKKGLLTIRDIISCFAPPSENDTEKYIAYVSDKCDIPSTAVLYHPIDFAKVLRYMAVFETGSQFASYWILTNVIEYFNIKVYEKK